LPHISEKHRPVHGALDHKWCGHSALSQGETHKRVVTVPEVAGVERHWRVVILAIRDQPHINRTYEQL
jgi:hypothetical protein